MALFPGGTRWNVSLWLFGHTKCIVAHLVHCLHHYPNLTVSPLPKVNLRFSSSCTHLWSTADGRFSHAFQARWLAPSPHASRRFSGKIQGTVVWLLALIFHRLTNNTNEFWDSPLRNICALCCRKRSLHLDFPWWIFTLRSFINSPILTSPPWSAWGYFLWVFPHCQWALSHGHMVLGCPAFCPLAWFPVTVIISNSDKVYCFAF